MNLLTKYLLVFLSALLCSLPLQANQLPKAFSATYKANYNGIEIKATRSLTANGPKQTLNFTANSWLASIVEESLFEWGEHGYLIPQKYRYDRTGVGRERHALLTFDWDQRNVVNQVQDSKWKMDLPEIALDKLSYQLQLRKDLINSSPLGPYQIADGGRLKTYEFEKIGESVIDTPMGKLNTVEIKRIRKKKNRTTHIWLAKDWDYLIVKIQQLEKDGKSYEINIAQAVVDKQTVTGL
ncbi:MAG: DUF3108 domain-containing protein [Candidatus Pelagadaptatus aseana]|uniref:DUF3108 domain-containing protein n=1 Tax=Candidatus Pelagadaptatus aseana TaxID=3120508 RepID=UPI0039B339F6